MEYIPTFSPKPLAGILIVLIVFCEIRRGYFSNFKNRAKQACSALRFLPILFSFTGLAMLMLADPVLRTALQSLQTPVFTAWASLGHQIGKNTLAVLIGIYLITFLARAPKKYSHFIFSASLASAVTGIATTAIKFMILRARPYSDLGAFSFFNLSGFWQDERAFQSFPSGDVAMIAGAAGYLFHRLRAWRLRWLILLLPLSTAFARVAYNRHWPSDTIASLLLGLALSYAVQIFEQSPNKETR